MRWEKKGKIAGLKKEIRVSLLTVFVDQLESNGKNELKSGLHFKNSEPEGNLADSCWNWEMVPGERVEGGPNWDPQWFHE